MDKKAKAASCCGLEGEALAGCRLESLITVDERGQMVLPKELRDRAGIKGGDKLAVVSWEKDGQVCALSLIKVEAFSGMVKGLLGPVMSDVLRKA